MHTLVVVVILDICPEYSAQIIHDSSQPKRSGSISNPAEIPHPSPLADTPILTWSAFYLTPCIPCAISGFVQGYSYFSTAFLWHIFYSSVFVWHRPKGCELQNRPRGLMFGLNTQWNSTANTFLTPPLLSGSFCTNPSPCWVDVFPGFLLFSQTPERPRGQMSHRILVLSH